MSPSPKHWQATLWIGPKDDQPITFYGASHAMVRSAVAAWLHEHKPKDVWNTPAKHDSHHRLHYFALENVRVPKVFSPWFEDVADNNDSNEHEYITVWSYNRGRWDDNLPNRLNDFDALVQHVLSTALIIEKGPEHQEIALVDGAFPLHLVKTVRREQDEQRANDLLQRGWYLLTLEGTEQRTGRTSTKRAVVFVLGHSEPNAF